MVIGYVPKSLVKKFMFIMVAVITVLLWDVSTTVEAAVTMHVNNANIAALVRGIARSEGIPIIGTETLSGEVTADFNHESGKEAICMLGKLKHFSVTEEKGILVVDGSGMENKEDRQAHIIVPKHLSPPALADALAAVIDTKRCRVIKATNQIMVYATPAEWRHITEVLDTIDRIPQQVHIEAAVVAMEASYMKEAGIEWSWQSLTGHGEDSTHEYGAITYGKLLRSDMYHVLVKPTLHASETEGKSVLITKPSIMTVNGEEAKILIGDKLPVLVENREDGETRTTVRYEESGIRLTCTPYVTSDGSVDADIFAEVSSPSMVSELKAYRITSREAHARVHLRRGEVLVIGGLMDNRTGRQESKVPLLGDLPLVGHLFRHARRTKDSVELCILVKADVIPAVGYEERPLQYVPDRG